MVWNSMASAQISLPPIKRLWCCDARRAPRNFRQGAKRRPCRLGRPVPRPLPPSPAPTPGAPTKAPTSPPTLSPTHQVATYEDLPPSLVQVGTNHAGKAVMKLELETAAPTARPTAAPTPVPTGFPTPLPTASPTGLDQLVALVLRIPVLIHRSYRPISRSKSKQSTICHAVASSAGFELDKNRGACAPLITKCPMLGRNQLCARQCLLQMCTRVWVAYF